MRCSKKPYKLPHIDSHTWLVLPSIVYSHWQWHCGFFHIKCHLRSFSQRCWGLNLAHLNIEQMICHPLSYGHVLKICVHTALKGVKITGSSILEGQYFLFCSTGSGTLLTG